MDKERNAKSIREEASSIIEILKNGDSNYIFGNGWMGHKFFDTVTAMGISVSGYIVSQKKADVNGTIPVLTIAEMEQREEDCNIFVALRDQDESLNQKLRRISNKVYPITYPRDITLIEANYYLDYFETRHIDCSKEEIEISDFVFPNPFRKPDDYLLSWVYEAGDLILSVLCNDVGRIDEGPYEKEHLELQKGDIVLDCGANIGLFSSIAVQKGCKVYAFEPMPEAINYLKELKDTYKDELEICPYALSDKIGKANFLVQNNDLIGASLFENNNVVDKTYEVDVLTIDTFVEKNNITKVDYIKADIEGSERDMLKGAERTIKKYLPKISICTYHLEDDKEVLENIIRGMSDQYIIEHKWKKLYAYVK